MTTRQRRVHDHAHIEKTARARRERLGLLLTALSVFLVGVLCLALSALAFEAGRDTWPQWLVDHRAQAVGITGLALLVVIALLPIILEVRRDPRHLSGPGHDPRQGPLM